ncbi:MAG: 50S ribosomal protein L30 [Clostridia bacterium]|nr:50S ribosomal protein L30 [Clostridia bacterium]MBR2449653.1 50S ribosomal protein L30 [Clostridia bacterium]
MAKAKKEETGKIKVTLVKSTIAILPQHKKIVAALGLKKIRSFRVHEENPCILGMIAKVKYLVKVEKI